MAINLYKLNHPDEEVSPTFIESCDSAEDEELKCVLL
jgi:hypothetical protein